MHLVSGQQYRGRPLQQPPNSLFFFFYCLSHWTAQGDCSVPWACSNGGYSIASQWKLVESSPLDRASDTLLPTPSLRRLPRASPLPSQWGASRSGACSLSV